ncbi:metallophosphoesterase [Tersicoccus sp. MR15.9]|uniref:metallophosphoesterase family protein n=1 Tax=Tersicoccus mangrovi TaxID=3121635 RepID=UPI002FE67EA3
MNTPRILGLAAAAALSLTTIASAGVASTAQPQSHGTGEHATSSVLAAVGDVACEPDTAENAANPASLKCGSSGLGGLPAEYAVADQIEGMKPQLAAILGDEQYEVGKLSDFQNSYDKTFGAFKWLQRPAPGNHEYYSYTKHGDNEPAQNGTGYFSYFNGTDATGAIRPTGQAGDYNHGWYSYDLGNWHIVSLNVECKSAAFGNNCDPHSGVLGQETAWLAADLKKNRSACTLAYWHQPAFTASGSTGTDPAFGSDEGKASDAWWSLLYQNRADVVLNGHEHLYARFSPMNPSGAVDSKRGITQFIVGTGGEDLDSLSTGAALTQEHVVTGQDQAYGAMKLTLGAHGYQWDYKPTYATAGAASGALAYQDSGSATCHAGENGNH